MRSSTMLGLGALAAVELGLLLGTGWYFGWRILLSLVVATGALGVFVVVFALVVLALSRWRGDRTLTARCLKCGTPFCQRCQLRTSVAGLCTQCYHLFIVRDGVSTPARNQKMQEVHREEERKQRVFRILSLAAPGAGHLYAQKPLIGVPLVLAWSALLALAAVAGPLAPLTWAAPLPPLIALWAALLLAVYLLANLRRPSFEVALIPPRRGTRRGYPSRSSG